MARIGYARVSTADQDLPTARQLEAEGCGLIRSVSHFKEAVVVSVSASRPELHDSGTEVGWRLTRGRLELDLGSDCTR
jgi:DNA invertase Pin-like site-specific DNA recombinase